MTGVPEACARFADAGLVLVVVTNQPDLARGLLSHRDLAAIHEELLDLLPLDDVVVCPHDSHEGCPCRKPRPGMILDAARRLDLDLDRSVCVGDRWRDVDAAHRAGVHAVHLDWGHGEGLRAAPDAVFGSLLQAADHVLERTGRPRDGDTPPREDETT